MKIYRPRKVNRVFIARAYLAGPKGDAKVTLLVDTGATCTMIDAYILQQIGYDPAASTDRIQIITANGRITVPRIRVTQLHSFGQVVDNFYVLAHVFSQATYFDGLLGMDFLERFPIEIRPYSGEVVARDSR